MKQWHLDQRQCIGCGICADLCPRDAIRMTGEMTHPQAAFCPAEDCVLCAQQCPAQAIELGQALVSG